MRAMATIWLVLLLPAAALAEMEERALERLRQVTDRMIAVGESMVGRPVSGLIALEDTVDIPVSLDTTYSYHMHIWTNSSFNLLELWMATPAGDVVQSAEGDHATLSIYPETSGRYNLRMTLHQGDYSDSAGYAAALFHRPRIISPSAEED